jgi:hypothetical protein
VVFNRIFFRNFLPPAPSGAAGAARRAALLRPRPGGLDWESPTPFVAGGGGGATYNLVVWHFQPTMVWAFDEKGTYW